MRDRAEEVVSMAAKVSVLPHLRQLLTLMQMCNDRDVRHLAQEFNLGQTILLRSFHVRFHCRQARPMVDGKPSLPLLVSRA